MGASALHLGKVATVPTACGIETHCEPKSSHDANLVATVPTACGIETGVSENGIKLAYGVRCNSTYRLRY